MPEGDSVKRVLILFIVLLNAALQGAELTRQKTYWYDILPLDLQNMIKKYVLGDLIPTSPQALHLLRTLMPPTIYHDHEFQNFSDVNVMSMTPNGRHALTASSADTLVLLWRIRYKEADARNANVVALSGHTTQISALCMSDDAHLALAGALDGSLMLWKKPRFNPLRLSRLEDGHTNCITAICMNKNKNLVLSGSEDGVVVLWDISDLADIRSCVIARIDNYPIKSVYLTNVSDFDFALIIGQKPEGRYRPCFIYDVTELSRPNTDIPENVLSRLRALAGSIGFAGGWQLLGVRGNMIGLLQLPGIDFDVKKLRHRGPISSFCMSQDNSTLLSGSDDMHAIAWVLNGDHKYRLFRYRNRVLSVAISEDNRWALVGSAPDVPETSTLILWDLMPFYDTMDFYQFMDIYGRLLSIASAASESTASAAIPPESL